MKDIETDEQLVAVLDELKHRLKPGVAKNAPLCVAFNQALNVFIKTNRLDQDQHAFASTRRDR